ncbi:hypothetical protein KFL_002410030 [Klebsormidium nitens]|uniref:Uncharacterized protein n=1 Tax=Klebsormidium nitens TaxID=105231 RepID=A0A1Y1I4Y0_KLENI|nr:hypothetical protein KFL_002410030 [Klebsormidium nitens]|eukprot:GAQ85553.1 hypothetical protein KFL_002410030 [Klebsormidium nitens]
MGSFADTMAFFRFAEYDAAFQEQLERFERLISSEERFSRPYQTGIRMGLDDFRSWAAKNHGDMMLWFDEGDVSILGRRASRTHRIADVAVHVLQSGIRNAANEVLRSMPVHGMFGRFPTETAFFETSAAAFRDGGGPAAKRAPNIALHDGFEPWADRSCMTFVGSRLLAAVPGCSLFLGLQPFARALEAVVMWQDPEDSTAAVVTEWGNLDSSPRIPLWIIFEGERNIPAQVKGSHMHGRTVLLDLEKLHSFF